MCPLFRLVAVAILSTVVSAAAAGSAGAEKLSVGARPGASLSMRLSTNLVYAGMVEEAPGGLGSLEALEMPLVRIHAGNDGTDPPALPEVRYGEWSFEALDQLIGTVYATGQRPLLNIKFAPDWMWTCGAAQDPGTVRDQSFAEFGDYMARLVSYYNLGYMVTEDGRRIENPAGTSHRVDWWELWNEPDLTNETPCSDPRGFALDPQQYRRMWDAVTSRMLAVSPGLHFVGPATAGGQFGSDASSDYLARLRSAPVAPSAISFHGYGYWDNTVSDRTLFSGDPTGAGGIGEIARSVAAARREWPGPPIWITEMNVNADWGSDRWLRPSGPLGLAWWAAAYSRLAAAGAGMLYQYDFVDSPQFGLIDDQTGSRRPPFWLAEALQQSFPVASRVLAHSHLRGIDVLAARRPDGGTAILIADERGRTRGRGGAGKPVRLSVETRRRGRLDVFDRRHLRAPRWRAWRAREPVRLAGYGAAILLLDPSR